MSSDGGYCRIFWGRVPWMSWYFSGDLINQCDLSNICCALQLTWKLTNHMKISPCLQDMLCFVKWLPKHYSITHGHSANITKKSRDRDDFSFWKYRLPFLLSLMVLQSSFHFTHRFRIPRSQCTHWHLCPSPDRPGYEDTGAFCQLWIWKNMRKIWVKMDQNTLHLPQISGVNMKNWLNFNPPNIVSTASGYG